MAEWLGAAGLGIYAARFESAGYDGLDVCAVRLERGGERTVQRLCLSPSLFLSLSLSLSVALSLTKVVRPRRHSVFFSSPEASYARRLILRRKGEGEKKGKCLCPSRAPLPLALLALQLKSDRLSLDTAAATESFHGRCALPGRSATVATVAPGCFRRAHALRPCRPCVTLQGPDGRRS